MTEPLIGSEVGRHAGPYPGLKPFSEEESEFFFGRERDSEIIVANLRARRLTILYGPSGVGKSSVLRAGVAASLRRRAAAARAKRGRAEFVPVVVDQWKDDPIAGIVAAVERAVQDLVGDERPGPRPTGDLTDDLLAWSEHFGGELLLILDQFEELFEYHRTPGGKGSIDEELPQAVTEALPLSILISIREDALALFDDRFKRSVPGLLDSRLRIAHLDRKDGKAAILKPVDRYNEEHGTAIEIEPALVEEVLDQVTRGRVSLEQTGAGAVDGGEPELAPVETPYLQLVLSRLWNEEQQAGSTVLRLQTLTRLGGAEKIVRTHLDEALESFPEDEQDVAADVFKYLVTPSGTKIALRPADLAAYAEHPEETIQPVLRKLSDRRIGILRPVAPPPGAQSGPRYEIYHDVLAGAILDWRSRHSHADLVREKEAAEEEAREAQQRHEREKRRSRMFRGLLIASLVLLAGTVAALVFGLLKRQEAQQTRQAAQSAALAARAFDESNPAVAGLTALEAFRLSETREARSAILDLIQENTGIPKLLFGHIRNVKDVAFTPDSKVLVSGSGDGTVRLWDTTTGEAIGPPLRMGAYDPPTIESVAVSPDGRLLAAAGDDGEATDGRSVRLWALGDSGEPPKRLPSLTPHSADTNVIAFGPGRPLVLAAGGSNETITLWNLSNPRKPRRLPMATTGDDNVNALAFSRNGRTLASGDDYGDTRLWRIDPRRGARLLTKTPSTRPDVFEVWGLAFSPRGDVLLAGGKGRDDNEVPLVVWDVSTPTRPRALKAPVGHAGPVFAVDFDAQGRRAVSAGYDGHVLVWDTDSWSSFGPLRMHDYQWDIEAIALSPDGKTIASGDSNGLIKLWSVVEPRALAAMLGAPDRLTWSVAVTPDGVATASEKKGIDVWPIAATDRPPRRRAYIERESDGTSYAVASHGSLLVGATGYGFGLWDLSGEQPRLLSRAKPLDDWILDIDISDDGKTVATSAFSGKLALWDISDRDEVLHLKTLTSHGGDAAVLDIEFSPTSATLVSAGDDGTVRFWDVADPTSPVELRDEPLVPHDGEAVKAVGFSPDGRLLATGGGDLRAVVWNVSDPSSVSQVGREVDHTNDIVGLSFGPGDVLAVTDSDSSVVMYDVRNVYPLGYGLLGRVGGNSTFEAAVFDEAGETLYSAGRWNPVMAWKSDLWSNDVTTLGKYVCMIVGRDLEPDEWNEMFYDTDLEGRYRRTCSDG